MINIQDIKEVGRNDLNHQGDLHNGISNLHSQSQLY